MNCMKELLGLQSVLPVKSSPTPGKKLNIALKCVVPRMVPILRSMEHKRNVVRYSVLKCVSFFCTLSDQSYTIFILFHSFILFYLHLGPDALCF
jgi:hypothetical protein